MITIYLCDISLPFLFSSLSTDSCILFQFILERSISIAKSQANDIIIPDPAPQVSVTFITEFD
jgi:hypothetical protein